MKFIDLSGSRYADWTILSRADNQGRCTVWNAKCKCGKEEKIRSGQIFSLKARKHCGCLDSWLGMKFGRLTVIEHGKNGNYNNLLLCKCECGNTKKIWGTSLKNGSSKSCGCILEEKGNKRGFNTIFNGYKKKSKIKNQEFEFCEKTFMEITQRNCFYCDSLPNNRMVKSTKTKGIRSFLYNGIDRVDNKLGYTKENCVPCCKTCNLMKKDMNLKDWIDHLRKILDKQTALVG